MQTYQPLSSYTQRPRLRSPRTVDLYADGLVVRRGERVVHALRYDEAAIVPLERAKREFEFVGTNPRESESVALPQPARSLTCGLLVSNPRWGYCGCCTSDIYPAIIHLRHNSTTSPVYDESTIRCWTHRTQGGQLWWVKPPLVGQQRQCARVGDEAARYATTNSHGQNLSLGAR